MDPHQFNGTYTYRSFINEQSIVDDFSKLQFAEAELSLFASGDGTVTGLLSWPTKDDDSERAYMDINGRIVKREPFLVQFDGIGRKGSAVENFHYRYELQLAKSWPEVTKPRTCLVGSVLRVKDHGSAKAGVAASVIAVRREFVEPRDIAGVALIPSTQAMLATKWHRLWHATWHTVRGAWSDLTQEATRQQIAKLGWGLDRPPLRQSPPNGPGGLILDNGAGEDFLFMHRWMIKMVHDDYAMQGATAPASWKTLPSPASPQASFLPITSPAGIVTFKRDTASSGNMIPPADTWQKTPEYFNTVMRRLAAQFASPTTLASLSLGALGNMIEFTIHNAMHMRWASPARDPDTGELILDPVTGAPGERPSFDFSDKWNSPNYDYLGEFYSSHVNPLFWRLHGWVDDRIDDWFKAQEAARPGNMKRRQLHGIDWFEVNPPLVIAPEPYVGVSLDGGHHGHAGHGGHHGGGDQQAKEIETMLMVLAAIENDAKLAEVRTTAAVPAPRPAAQSAAAPISMRFKVIGDGFE